MKQINKKQKKGMGFFIKQIVLGIFDALILIILGTVGGLLIVYNKATPAASQLMQRKIAQTSVIYDRSGQRVLYELHGEENRKIISHSEIPNNIRIVTIATEDKNFYNHPGVDIGSILRAFKVNLTHDDIRQGGSTITQQLVRNAFLTREKTLKRKFLEIVIAVKMERHYSKDQILDAYLNEIPYGANAYGIQTAAQTFFSKDAKDLTLDEAALIAALPKAPTYYSPYNTHKEELKFRQQAILMRAGELGLASKEDIDRALAINTLEKVSAFHQYITAPHFVFYVIEQVENQYGKEFLETGGLKIYTTLDLDMQKRAEDVVSDGVKRNFVRGATNAGLVAIDPKSGDVLAMVGSRDFFDKSIDGQVNVTISPRQPGSSFKPFAYATAFEKGYQPETLIVDAPTNFGPDGSGKNYIPRNYDGKFHGLLTMRQALSQSLNVPAVKTLYLAGIDATIDTAHKLGITTLNDRKRYGLSLVLGGGEVKLLDMTSAFSVFANEGQRNPVQSIFKITDHSGKIINQENISPKTVLDVQIARKINSILSDNKARTPIFGARSALVLDDGRPVAAKTGTTQQFRDAWTVGYTPSLAVGVWAGNNNNNPMKGGADGVFVAAPIWKDFMQKSLAGKPFEQFIAYDTYVPNNTPKPDTVLANSNMTTVVTYYNNKTGKKISEEKARKMDPSKVDKRIKYIPSDAANNDAGSQIPMSIALPNPNDPMYKRWIGQMPGASGEVKTTN